MNMEIYMRTRAGNLETFFCWNGIEIDDATPQRQGIQILSGDKCLLDSHTNNSMGSLFFCPFSAVYLHLKALRACI